MFIRKIPKTQNGRKYLHYALVESVRTEKGPRQKIICSLGSMKPRPKKEWLALAKKVEDALLGQTRLNEEYDEEVEDVLRKAKTGKKKRKKADSKEELVAVNPNKVKRGELRSAGHIHAGLHFWNKVDMDDILKSAGLSEKARVLTLAMTMNRLICPKSEHAMPGWINRTALSDIIGVDFRKLKEDSLYRNMDSLHSKRGEIEKALADKESRLYNLDNTIYLYDLTSTYFEGECKHNPKAKRGYSRDKRPDCKQVVIGLVINRDGFPKAHEIFSGERQDRTTVGEMLDLLEERTCKQEGATVVVDRGMAYDENLREIKSRGYHYIVASRQSQRMEWLDEFEDEEGWEEVIRKPSPTNPFQKKSRVTIKKKAKGNEAHVLCRSEGRENKDAAIWESREKKFLEDIRKLKARIKKGRLKREEKIYEALGRLRERYPALLRYYEIEFDKNTVELSWDISSENRKKLETLFGSYILKTDIKYMSGDEIWRTYSLLTRAESAFRALKSPLSERPIFHRLENRVETHIFLCILAYHLLVAIEQTLKDKRVHTSWETVREELSTHNTGTIVFPTSDGDTIRIRRGAEPEPEHIEIYRNLGMSEEIMKPEKTYEKKRVV